MKGDPTLIEAGVRKQRIPIDTRHACLRGLARACARVSVCACETLGVTENPLIVVFFFFVQFQSAGGLVVHASTSPTKRLALNTDIGGDAHGRTCFF